MTEDITIKERQLIDTARSLFTRHGIRRVTIDEICKTAGISRVTFYKHFRNKEEVAIRALDEIMEENITLFRDIMDSEETYHQKLRRIFDLKIQKSREYGSPFLQDILSARGKLHDFILKKRQENISLTRQLLEEGQKAGEIHPGITVELFLYYGDLLTRAVEDDIFTALIPDIQTRIEEVTRFFLYGIINEKIITAGGRKKERSQK